MPIARLRLFAFLACLFAPATGLAQITFIYDYTDTFGFYTPARRTALERAGTYLTTQMDARGVLRVELDTVNNSQVGNGTLAQAGTSFSIVSGTATNGSAFRQATTTTATSPSGQIFMDFNRDQSAWFTEAGSSGGSGQFDMQSVTLHELSHGLGFLSLLNPDGSGIGGSSTWSQLDANLRVGSGASAPRLLSGTQGSYAFNSGAVSTADLNGTNVYFHGEFAKAANGGNAVQMAGSGDLSHLGAAAANAVMLPAISAGTDRRAYQNLELGMMIDNGWNQFVWKDATGNFADNVASTSGARWQNLDGANMLSPVGTITKNAVLRFGGTGGYTATNNLTLAATAATGNDANRHLLTRLILNATAGSSTIAATGANTFRFDSTIGVVPQIRQDGAGAFVISHPLELTGRNLQLAGAGAGRVTLSGAIGQQAGQVGSVTKLDTSTFVLSGNNTYSGGTTVTAGTLLVNGQSAGQSGTGTGAVTVTGGTLGGTGRIGGATTITVGTLAPGDNGAGVLTLDGNLTFASSGTRSLALELNGATAGTGHDRLAVNGTVALNGATLNATRSGYTPGAADKLFVVLNDGTDAVGGTFGGLADGASFDLGGVTAYIYYQGDFGTGSLTGGNDVVIAFTPVPEPATVLAVGAAGLGAITWLRRRKVARAEPTTAA